jgi:dTDP-4-amino-4,6-dideoxy-D-galactose acyltransferase
METLYNSIKPMIDELIAFREDKLFYYSEANFIKKIKRDIHRELVNEKIQQYFRKTKEHFSLIEVSIEGKIHYFLLEFLAWDTSFFGKKIYKLFTALYNHQDFAILTKAVEEFKKILLREYQAEYCFVEIPSEDILFLQALTASRFKLVETRLTCYFELTKFHHERSYKVRRAIEADIPSLSNAAAAMSNTYDRFHADVAIDSKQADTFLAKYIEEGVKGYLDMVLVPAIDDAPPDGFVSYNYQPEKWERLGCKVAKLILTAVLFETRRGWFYKLSVEMLRDLQERGLEYAYFQTQSANRVMYKTMEKLGSKYGGSSHILSILKK